MKDLCRSFTWLENARKYNQVRTFSALTYSSKIVVNSKETSSLSWNIGLFSLYRSFVLTFWGRGFTIPKFVFTYANQIKSVRVLSAQISKFLTFRVWRDYATWYLFLSNSKILIISGYVIELYKCIDNRNMRECFFFFNVAFLFYTCWVYKNRCPNN